MKRNSGDHRQGIEIARENAEGGTSRLLDDVAEDRKSPQMKQASAPLALVSPRVDDLLLKKMGSSPSKTNAAEITDENETTINRQFMDTAPSEQVATIISYSPDELPAAADNSTSPSGT